jgi:hypothetical protein
MVGGPLDPVVRPFKRAFSVCLDIVIITGCVRAPATTPSERAAAARAKMKASMDRCEQAVQQKHRAGATAAPTPEMADEMKQCDASKVPGLTTLPTLWF